MNELETFNQSDFETLTHDQRKELTAHLSDHVVLNEISTFENSLNLKVSKIGDEIRNDPDVLELKNILNRIKAPAEQETLQNYERIDFIKQQISENKHEEPMPKRENFNYEERKKEKKTKLNIIYKRLIDGITSIDFASLGTVQYPEDLTPSFDRYLFLMIRY